MKFGTDGVRGVANTDLTASFALDLGRAAAACSAARRPSSAATPACRRRCSRRRFVAGLASEGVVVHRLGVVPTPVVAFEAARRDCLGAMISASHNPYHDNGIKLFARGGTKLTDEVEERIEAERRRPPGARPVIRPQLVDVGGQPRLPRARPGRARRAPASRRAADRRRRRQRCGAARSRRSAARRRRRRRRRHPRRARRAQHQRRVRGDRHGVARRGGASRHGADLGVALDGDADRLMAVDHTGAARRRRPRHRHLRPRPARPRRCCATAPSSSP